MYRLLYYWYCNANRMIFLQLQSLSIDVLTSRPQYKDMEMVIAILYSVIAITLLDWRQMLPRSITINVNGLE